MSQRMWVAGIGMIQFEEPGASPAFNDAGSNVILLALTDTGIGNAAV